MRPRPTLRTRFFAEVEELVGTLRYALRRIEDGDPAAIDAAYRAVHAIKGSSASFGLGPTARFALNFETALHRAKGTPPDAEQLDLFRRCADTLAELIEDARSGKGTRPAEIEAILAPLAPAGPRRKPGDQPAPPPPASAPARHGPLRSVSISLGPTPDLYHRGHEPVRLIRAILALGSGTVTCTAGQLPDLAAYSARTSALSWRIDLDTRETDEAIRAALGFAAQHCNLRIQPATEDAARA